MVCDDKNKQGTSTKIKAEHINLNIPDEIIDIDITKIKQYLDDDAWELLTKLGMFNCSWIIFNLH